jgi:hypothetical protein
MKLSHPCLFAMLWLLASVTTQAAQWPEVRLPASIRIFDIGAEMNASGLPMQARGFTSQQDVAHLVEQFRASLGAPLVENRMGARTILGREQGSHYLTVQLEPAGSGARGVIALSDLPAMAANRESERALRAGWLARLPAGLHILSLVTSRDGARRAQHIVLHSPHLPASNRDVLVAMLAQDGYGLQQVASSTEPPGETLYFQAPGREATAVVTRNADGSSGIVLNLVVMSEKGMSESRR